MRLRAEDYVVLTVGVLLVSGGGCQFVAHFWQKPLLREIGRWLFNSGVAIALMPVFVAIGVKVWDRIHGVDSRRK